MKIGAIWSILFGLIALIVGAVMAFSVDTIGEVNGGYIFLVFGIIGLIIGAYDFYKK